MNLQEIKFVGENSLADAHTSFLLYKRMVKNGKVKQ